TLRKRPARNTSCASTRNLSGTVVRYAALRESQGRDRPHSERIVPKAREHHAVVCDRSAADAAEGFALGVRVLQADLVPPEGTAERLAPETGGSLLHDPGVAHTP